MEINAAALTQNLCVEPPAENIPVCPYLLEHVLHPYLRGETVRIGNLDYGAFSPQEMNVFLKYVHHLAEENEKTEGLWQSLRRCKPMVYRTLPFC